MTSVALLRSQIILNNHRLKTLLESVTFFTRTQAAVINIVGFRFFHKLDVSYDYTDTKIYKGSGNEISEFKILNRALTALDTRGNS